MFGSRYLTGFVPGMSLSFILVYLLLSSWSTNYFQLAEVLARILHSLSQTSRLADDICEGPWAKTVIWIGSVLYYISPVERKNLYV